MSEKSVDTSTKTPISRRRVLGYLGAAVGGAILDRSLIRKSGHVNMADGANVGEPTSSDPESVKISAETANVLKSRASELSKRAFNRDGYSGVRQSDNLVAELWNESTRLTISLAFKGSANRNVLDFGPDDISSVGIKYATLDDNVGLGTGESDHTRGTIPPISTGGSAKNAFNIEIFEQSPKALPPEYRPQPQAVQSLPVEHFLLVSEIDLHPTNHDGTPLKPPTYEGAIDLALAQFE